MGEPPDDLESLHDWLMQEPCPTDDDCLLALHDWLFTLRRTGRQCPATIAAKLRLDRANLARHQNLRMICDGDEARLARTDQMAVSQQLAVVKAEEELWKRLPVLPAWKEPSIRWWICCWICGAKPETYDPLPAGWRWDSADPECRFVHCPEHRIGG